MQIFFSFPVPSPVSALSNKEGVPMFVGHRHGYTATAHGVGRAYGAGRRGTSNQVASGAPAREAERLGGGRCWPLFSRRYLEMMDCGPAPSMTEGQPPRAFFGGAKEPQRQARS